MKTHRAFLSVRLTRLGAVLLILLLGIGCVSINVGGPGRGRLRETVVYGSKGPKLLMLEIQGAIRDEPEPLLLGFSREATTARVREVLDRARRSSKIKGVLLRIDSPGGTATASEIVYEEILRFKRETGLPVVAQLMGTAASGGYYVAMAADEVRAHPTSVTGSIGVIFIGANFVGLMDKLGIENQTLTAGVHKDAGLPLRRMSAEERAHLQSILDDLHARFQSVVVEGRPGLSPEQVAELSDGSVYSAQQALANGLVDDLGTLQEAIESLEERAGISQSRVVSYHRRREFRRNIYTESGVPQPTLKVDFGELVNPVSPPGFHFLWWPGAR